MTSDHLLITIPISHYCERARWALDYAGVPYQEQRHLQLFHERAVKKAAGRAKQTTPVLVTPDAVLTDSAEVLQFADQAAPSHRKLYSMMNDEAKSVERRIAEQFGVETRRVAYSVLLPNKQLLLRYNNVGAPAWQALLLRVFFGPASRKAQRVLQVDSARCLAGLELIREELSFLQQFRRGRAFLSGERFGALDLTVAALLAPLVLPLQYGIALPKPEELDERGRQLVDEFRQHPLGQHVLATYQRYRRPQSE